MEFIGGFFTGMLVLILYGAYRGCSSDGWDDSNMLNWIRLFSHIVLHPEDFTRMYYLDPIRSPFPYLSKDEFAENFPDSRPKKEDI